MLKNIPNFSFNEASLSDTEGELNLINPRKATTSNSIPPELLKVTTNICSELLKTAFNKKHFAFEQLLKLSETLTK